ncbi:MAG: cbb3-type cytochrome oxidase assembly protein CcoS [Polynucleobacter victoriensis]
MESLYLLIPMSLVVIGFIVAVLYWSVKNGQFEDLEGPGHAILMDDDTPKSNSVSDKADTFSPINTKN